MWGLDGIAMKRLFLCWWRRREFRSLQDQYPQPDSCFTFIRKNARLGFESLPCLPRRHSSPQMKNALAGVHSFAETEGFEPSEPFTARLVSSEVLSTTQPRLLEV